LTLLSFPWHSLDGTQLCSLYNVFGNIWGNYVTEGIIKLCEGLKGSAVTSLRCAVVRPSVRFSVSAH